MKGSPAYRLCKHRELVMKRGSSLDGIALTFWEDKLGDDLDREIPQREKSHEGSA